MSNIYDNAVVLRAICPQHDAVTLKNVVMAGVRLGCGCVFHSLPGDVWYLYQTVAPVTPLAAVQDGVILDGGRAEWITSYTATDPNDAPVGDKFSVALSSDENGTPYATAEARHA